MDRHGRRGTQEQASQRRGATQPCCRRRSCARSACRSCSPRASAISACVPKGSLAECVEQVIGELRAPRHHVRARVLPRRRRLLDRRPRGQRQHPLVPRQPDALAAGERPPVRVHARRGADVPAPRGRARHQLRVRAVAAAGLDADLRRLPASLPRRLQPATRGAATTSATCTARACTTTPRNTPTRTGPRRSRSGWTPGPWRRRYRDWQVALAKLEYVDRIVGIERRVPRQPGQRPAGHARPVHRHQGDGRRVLRHRRHAVDPDLLEYREDLLEIFPRRPPRARAIAARGLTSRTANAQSAARFIQQHQTSWSIASAAGSATATNASILQLPAPAAGGLHLTSTWSSPTPAAPRSWSS